jgi:short-subunit dehydrogenase
MTKKDAGHILNVASIAGFMVGPLMATYYATKNYVVALTRGINKELKKKKSNVKLSVLCPGPVKTNFDNVANVKFNMMQLDSDYASKYAIDNMFLDKLIIVPPNMKLNKFLSKIGPTKLVLYINSKVQERKFKQ